MMKDLVFEENCQKVRIAAASSGYAASSVQTVMGCLKRLGDFLEGKGIRYSPDGCDESVQEFIGQSSGTTMKGLRWALPLLESAYRGESIEQHMSGRDALSKEFEGIFSEYIEYCRGAYSDAHLANISTQCRRFLRFLQRRGTATANGITCQLISEFHRSCKGSTRNIRTMAESHVKGMLRFMAGKGIVDETLWMFLEYLRDGLVFLLDELDENERNGYLSLDCGDGMGDAAFLEESKRFLKDLGKEGYSDSQIERCTRTLASFHVFLHANNLSYTPGIAALWVARVTEGRSQTTINAARHAMLLMDERLNGATGMRKRYPTKKRAYDLLPEWCRVEIDSFLQFRRREKMDDSTMAMDRTACTRFCGYIAAAGLSSFGELTPGVVKGFNASDCHGTPAAKNAFNSRIRTFLRFLARKNAIPSASLALALVAECSIGEKVVEVFSNEEKEAIDDYCRNAATPLELRDKAILRLGTMMGLRGSDIVTIRICDIDWKKRTINVMQEKTGIQVELAMPVQVGNALYEYLTKGRPANASTDKVFVRDRAPYCGLEPSACSRSLKKVVSTHGGRFHCARRTFASDMLGAGVKKEIIADSIGHRGTASLQPYLSLDEKRMEECPLSLKEIGVEGTLADTGVKGGGGHAEGI